MTNSFITERTRAVLLVPFFYAFFSRMKGLRGFGFNAATLWVPGVIITSALLGETSGGVWPAVLQYAKGYLVFICIYELGYIMNDTWGLRNDSTPRRRVSVTMGPGFIAVFVVVRLALPGVIALTGGYLFTGWFLALVGALVATIFLHNLMPREEFKLMSFLQMSLLRFCTPIFVACEGAAPLTIVIVALLLFSFPRFLTYQDSKGRLSIPERKLPFFGLGNCLCAAPLIGLTAYFEPGAGFLYTWCYFLILWTVVFAWSQRQTSKGQIL